MQIIRKQRKLVTVRRAARLRSAKLIIAWLGRGHHGWGGILSGSAQVVLRNPGQPPASPAQPRPHFPNFPRQECGLASPGQPGTITIPHTASHRLTRSVRWLMQPPQRIKQFSFVRRFLGPVDMLIITLDKLLPWLDSMQCTTLNWKCFQVSTLYTSLSFWNSSTTFLSLWKLPWIAIVLFAPKSASMSDPP